MLNLVTYLYRHSWKLMLLATLTSVIAGLCGASIVAVLSKAMGDTSTSAELAPLFFGLCLAYFVCKSFSEISLLRLTQGAILRLRISLSHKLLGAPLKKLQELGNPGLLAILTKDIETFVQAFQILPTAFGNAIIIVTSLAYLAWTSWLAFAVIGTCLAIGMAAFSFAERYPLRQLVAVREQIDLLFQHFRDLIYGSKELQLNAQRGKLFVEGVIAPTAKNLGVAYTRGMTSYTWVANIGSVLFYLLIGAALFILPLWSVQPTQVLVSTTLILLYLVHPISEMMIILPALRQASIALKRIEQLDQDLDAQRRAPAPAGAFGTPGPLTLELRQVCHHYVSGSDDRNFMLGPLDLQVRSGEILYIVGGNGTGKTTLAMLILGLFAPESGHLALNGVPVDEANMEAYRQHFSAVFSDFHLFEQLLESNESEVSGQAMEFIRGFGMAHKVKVVDGKFSTIKLSTGQRKRLALVASYLEDRPIYLFDEWAADQDPEFKRIFYTELLPLLKARGKIVLVITHDDAYFSNADRIAKIEDGRLRTYASDLRPLAA